MHNVVNPAVLEWAAGVDAVVTVQDHRFFCPGRGKWTSDGRLCGDPMGREVCAGCFDDPAYFESTLQLTAQRLEPLRRLRLTVLSSYMKRDVMPSRWQEPFGIVGLEALTLGTPVAAWDSGGVREWHPGGELLVSWGDVDGLARALRSGPAQGVDPPCGFEPEALVRRLEAVYGGRAPNPR